MCHQKHRQLIQGLEVANVNKIIRAFIEKYKDIFCLKEKIIKSLIYQFTITAYLIDQGGGGGGGGGKTSILG